MAFSIAAREHAYHAVGSPNGNASSIAEVVRQEELWARLGYERPDAEAGHVMASAHNEILRQSFWAPRHAILLLRNNRKSGDDAFRRMGKELDCLEVTGVGDGERKPRKIALNYALWLSSPLHSRACWYCTGPARDL